MRVTIGLNHITRLTALSLMFCLPSLSQAEPNYARQYKAEYGYQPSCNACHMRGGGSPLNAYGKAFEAEGKTTAAFASIANADSDGDGASNGAEAAAKANPGAADSTPDKPGPWLDTSNLIPKEVQAVFPGVKTYLPRDALLTEREIGRALAMGASLSAADENTIYIPLEGRKPKGVAIIVPGEFAEQRFFLMLATDPKLNITHVVPVNIEGADALFADDAAVLTESKGLAVKDLPASAEVASIEDAVRQAIKRGGTLLYVRLKKE